MEKIIYNMKLKKILVTLLLIFMLFNYITPNIVLAAVSWSGNNATGSIQEMADSMRTHTNASSLNGKQKTILDMLGTNKNDDLKNAIINKIKEAFPDMEEGLPEKVYNYYRNNQELIEITCGVVDGYQGQRLTGITVSLGNELTLEKIRADIDGKTDDEIGRVETQTRTETAPDSSAVGQDPNPDNRPTNDIVPRKSNLGGILLSPIFYLINFIADAIMINLEAIMTGEQLTIAEATGVGLLRGDPNDESLRGLSEEELNRGYSVKNIDMSSNFIGEIQYPKFKYTPEYIFSGECDILGIDFISNSDGVNQSVRNVVKGWYKALRLMAVIGMLSVLIYTGIKIIISANAKDKAKYKEWIINWFMGFALLFAMHIIMAFIISVIGEFRDAIAGSSRSIVIQTTVRGQTVHSETNLMGLVRFMIQSEDFYTKVAYEVMYIALIVYTIKFTIIYLKRVMNMAFLTLVAPIVALMYPIDKINDGRAQSFDMWLKEYIFNALLQPMHLLLYYILVGSAIDLATNNPIYGIVVLAFMTEAERLLKKIFGFDKASGGTVGGMTSAFAAGALASNIKNIARLGGSKGKGNSSKEQVDHSYLDNLKNSSNDSASKGFSDTLISGGSNDSKKQESNVQQEPEVEQNSEPLSSTEPDTPSGQTEPIVQNTEPQLGQADADIAGQEGEPQKTGTKVKVRRVSQGATSGSSTSGNVNPNDGKKGNVSSEEIEQIQTARERRHAIAEQRREAASNLKKEVPEPPKVNSNPVKKMAKQQEENRQKEKGVQDKLTDEEKAKIQTSQNGKKPLSPAMRGLKNVGKTIARPVYDFDRKGTGYNGRRFRRRIVNAGKGLGRVAVGAALGTAAAAVQMGISITDGKYNPLEGAATFAAGYAGGGQITKAIGRSTNKLTDAYKQGYYEDRDNPVLQEKLLKEKQANFMDNDEVFKAYKKKYGTSEKAIANMKLASENLLPYGYEDPKEQFKMFKMAGEIEKRNEEFKGLNDEGKANFRKQAVIQARNTKGFIEQLSSQGQLSAIRDPDKRESYINSEIEDRGLDKNSEEAQNIRKSLNNAFTSAGVWYDVNK